MLTSADTEQVVAVLREAASLIEKSPGLLKGSYASSPPLAPDQCFCLVGAVRYAFFESRRTESIQTLALTELAKTVHMSVIAHNCQASINFGNPVPGCVVRFNDSTLLGDRLPHSVNPDAKQPAIDLINQTIERLTKEN